MSNLIELLEDYMKLYYKEIIEERAIIAVEDGLKPVHRKILYSFHDRGYKSNKGFVKSVISAGSVLRFHPHGDAAVYDTAVNMSCYLNNVPMLQMHGGNRNIYGFDASANRYTELRTSKFADEVLLDNVDKKFNSVNYVPNFDESLVEPEYLPVKFPVFMLNGNFGIAGGFACSILPHSIKTICEKTKIILDNPTIDIDEFIKDIKPSFPTGGEIVNLNEVVKSYKTPSNIENTSSGKCIIRAKMNYIEKGNYISIYEIPYLITTDIIVDAIKQCVKNEIITGISAIKDFSAKGKIDIRIYLKKGTDENAIIAKLYSNTPCQKTIPIINIMTHKGKIKIYNNIKEMLLDWIDFRITTIKRIHNEQIKNLNYDKHIKEGLMLICDNPKNIDRLLKIVRDKNKTEDEIFTEVKNTFKLSDKQTEYILATKIIKLSNVSIKDLAKDIEELDKQIDDEINFMSSEKNIKESIKNDLNEIQKKYGKQDNPNGFITTYSNVNLDKNAIIEESIEDENYILVLTKMGLLKKIKLDHNIKFQKRRGVGNKVGSFKQNDSPAYTTIVNSKDIVLLFTDDGYCFRYKTYQLPSSGINTVGKTLLGLTNNKKVVSMIALTSEEFNDDNNAIITLTNNGKIKATMMSEFVSNFNTLIAVKLLENDRLKFVTYTNLLDITNKSIIITSKQGKIIRTDIDNIPVSKRTTIGVDTFQKSTLENINLLSCEVVDADDKLILVYSNGLAKRSKVSEFSKTNLRTKGRLTGIKENAKLVACLTYDNEEDILNVLSNKKAINVKIKDIKEVRRVAYGVSIKKLEKDEKIIDCTIFSGENISAKEFQNKKK